MSNPYNNNPMWILTRKFIVRFTLRLGLAKIFRWTFLLYNWLSLSREHFWFVFLHSFCEMNLRKKILLCHGNLPSTIAFSADFFFTFSFLTNSFMSYCDSGCFHAWSISLFWHIVEWHAGCVDRLYELIATTIIIFHNDCCWDNDTWNYAKVESNTFSSRNSHRFFWLYKRKIHFIISRKRSMGEVPINPAIFHSLSTQSSADVKSLCWVFISFVCLCEEREKVSPPDMKRLCQSLSTAA